MYRYRYGMYDMYVLLLIYSTSTQYRVPVPVPYYLDTQQNVSFFRLLFCFNTTFV